MVSGGLEVITQKLVQGAIYNSVPGGWRHNKCLSGGGGGGGGGGGLCLQLLSSIGEYD